MISVYNYCQLDRRHIFWRWQLLENKDTIIPQQRVNQIIHYSLQELQDCVEVTDILVVRRTRHDTKTANAITHCEQAVQ